ncbi:MAG: hydrogenase iron-sulfur subunit [Candidatus Kariarchaeaceae archaeon]|jgi:heterodisulfide reductase subunit A
MKIEDRNPVMIVGGGVAGIQASIDLGEAGVAVLMIDKSPAIGGKMAALDKNFPTLDCSICIEAPLMSEAMNHKNVEVRSLTEVVGVEGEVGNYTVTLKETQRYVTDECTRCDDCVQVCPQVLPNEFDEGMGWRKAIYTPFQQAEPGPYVIDMDDCLNNPPNYIPCERCVEACLPKCIDFNLPPERTYDVNVSSIIVATGFDQFDPAIIPEYSYGKHPDILTSMEYERMLNAAGPTEGHIIRPSNHEEPENVLFVLCVGSRDQRYCSYCSRVCCMYSIKEAYQTVDHGVKDVTVLYMDIRAYGKGFDEFHDRTLKEGIKYIRGRPAKIGTAGEKPMVTYENTETGELVNEEFDLIVLAPALLPSAGTSEIADLMGLDIDMDGYIESRDVQGLTVGTSREGIYVAGCASGPKDIPDSVTEAGAAAAAAMTHVTERFWPEEVYEETIDPHGEEKIGVFICDCGSNIAGTVKVPDVVDYASTLDNVIHSEEVMFACAGSTCAKISETIKEKGLNRLVVAACSPKTHDPTFQRAVAQAGLNKYLYEMSNIRNHNSWVHKKEPELATSKAKDMVRMSIEKSKLLVPLKESVLPVTQVGLVIGGGPAGMAAAWNLGLQGFETHLVESSDKLGGMLNELDRLAPSGAEAKVVLKKMLSDVEKADVNVHLNTTVEAISGAVGNYNVTLSDGQEFVAGGIVLAYGATAYEPVSFNYGENPQVLTNLDLESSLETRKEQNITFLGCVGSRVDEKGCSRYCCSTMIYQALKLREMGKKVTVLYKDIRTYTRHAEEMYFEACNKGVVFVQIPQLIDAEEHVVFEDGNVIAFDELLDSKVAIPTDLLVLTVGVCPPKDHSVADMLKVSKTTDDFLLELHPKLAPVEAAVNGVYMAGSVRGAVDLSEAISQGLAAAAKAADLLAKDTTIKKPLTAIIEADKCTGCMRCVKVCPFNAIEGEKKQPHVVIEAACTGCGTCAGECPEAAIIMPGFTDEQIMVQIDEALHEDPEDKVLVFACNWCSYAGADQAGIAKIQYPPSSRIIRTMCSARIGKKFVERAFEKDAGAVLMTGCRLTEKGSDCHYNFANVHTKKRYDRWVKQLQRQQGVHPDRLQLQWVSAAEGNVLAKKLYEMEKVLEKGKAGDYAPEIEVKGGD